MITIEQLRDPPWNRGEWHGQMVSLDGCATDDFAPGDISAVLATVQRDNDWDGSEAMIVRLKDGRHVVWSTSWDCTGSGFRCDAYGGNADIAFAHTFEAALNYLSEQDKE